MITILIYFLFANLYVLAKNGVYLIDKKTNYIKRKWNIKLKDAFLANDTVYGIGDSLYCLDGEEFIGISEIPQEYRTIIKIDDYIYGISSQKIYSFTNKKEITFIKRVIKFIKSFDKMWVADEGGVSVYNLSPGSPYYLEEEHRFPLEADYANENYICLSSYGLRIYIAKGNRIDVFETQAFRYITTIPINDKIKKIKFNTDGDNLYCITNKKIYVIKNNKVQNKINISANDIIFSQGYGVILTKQDGNNIFYFFNTQKNKVIKEWSDKLLDFVVRDSTAYFLTQNRLIAMSMKKYNNESFTSIKINTPNKIIKKQDLFEILVK